MTPRPPPQNPSPPPDTRWDLIRRKMEAHERVLARHGVLAPKRANGKTVWRVRFCEPGEDGKVIRRAIYIGSDPELVERARLLLQSFRNETELAKETAALAKLAIGLNARLRRRVVCMSRATRRGLNQEKLG